MRTGVVAGALAAIVGVLLLLSYGDPGGPTAFLVIGLAQGSAYGLLAIGLVLVYKGARVFNFAAGEFATFSVFISYLLSEQWAVDLPVGVAMAISLVAITLLGLLMERVLVRPLMNAPRITLLVTTIAFALLLVGVELLLFLPEPKNFPSIIPSLDAEGFPVGPNVLGYTLSPQEILLIGILIVLAIVLAWFFSKTDLGLAVLATSQDAFAGRAVGIGVGRMSMFIWGSAAFLAGVAGLIYTPIGGALAPGVFTTQTLIPAFTAAVIGGMTSLPGAFIGGLVVGLIQQLAQWGSSNYHLGGQTWGEIVPGAPDVALVVALLLVLLARPQGLLGKEA